jgi:hypothetical protein
VSGLPGEKENAETWSRPSCIEASQIWIFGVSQRISSLIGGYAIA